ncbi:MAG: hypothetical protein OEL53_18430 [Rhodospirillales bacterium]|nr:hypothetical protein [Rhodospirillales bacterium]
MPTDLQHLPQEQEEKLRRESGELYKNYQLVREALAKLQQILPQWEKAKERWYDLTGSANDDDILFPILLVPNTQRNRKLFRKFSRDQLRGQNATPDDDEDDNGDSEDDDDDNDENEE